MSRLLARWLALAGLALGLAIPAAAHDIPNDVRIQAFFRAEGTRATLLVRAPIEALGGAAMLFKGDGAVDLSNPAFAQAALARTWLANPFELVEDGVARAPELVAARTEGADLEVRLEFAIASDRASFTLRPLYATPGTQVLTVLRFRPPDGEEIAYEFHGDPGPVTLDPRWSEAARRFIVEGFFHILDGTDHLLFIAALVIPFRRLRGLVVIATGFTVAHSITLAMTALGLAPAGAWFPPVVEVFIAASIAWMAVENVLAPDLNRRWVLAFAFGLVHGFGFAFALSDTLQFAGSHLATSLVAFNFGVEAGQVALLLVLVPILRVFFRFVPQRRGVAALSAIVGCIAAWWLVERLGALRDVAWPAVDAAGVATTLRWFLGAAVLAALVWLADGQVRRWLGTAPDRVE